MRPSLYAMSCSVCAIPQKARLRPLCYVRSSTDVSARNVKLAFETLLHAHKPLGDGVWVFDASDTTNFVRRLSIRLELPDPSRVFEARAYGPFLVIRTRRPTVTIRRYLKLARQVEWVGVEQYLGDAFTNIFTIADASGRLARYERARNSASSASR